MCFSNTYVGKIARHIKAMGDVMKENDKPRMCFVASIKNRIKFFLKKTGDLSYLLYSIHKLYLMLIKCHLVFN